MTRGDDDVVVGGPRDAVPKRRQGSRYLRDQREKRKLHSPKDRRRDAPATSDDTASQSQETFQLDGVVMLDSPEWSSDDEMDNAEFNRKFRLQRYAHIRARNKQRDGTKAARHRVSGDGPDDTITVGTTDTTSTKQSKAQSTVNSHPTITSVPPVSVKEAVPGRPRPPRAAHERSPAPPPRGPPREAAKTAALATQLGGTWVWMAPDNDDDAAPDVKPPPAAVDASHAGAAASSTDRRGVKASARDAPRLGGGASKPPAQRSLLVRSGGTHTKEDYSAVMDLRNHAKRHGKNYGGSFRVQHRPSVFSSVLTSHGKQVRLYAVSPFLLNVPMDDVSPNTRTKAGTGAATGGRPFFPNTPPPKDAGRKPETADAPRALATPRRRSLPTASARRVQATSLGPAESKLLPTHHAQQATLRFPASVAHWSFVTLHSSAKEAGGAGQRSGRGEDVRDAQWVDVMLGEDVEALRATTAHNGSRSAAMPTSPTTAFSALYDFGFWEDLNEDLAQTDRARLSHFADEGFDDDDVFAAMPKISSFTLHALERTARQQPADRDGQDAAKTGESRDGSPEGPLSPSHSWDAFACSVARDMGGAVPLEKPQERGSNYRMGQRNRWTPSSCRSSHADRSRKEDYAASYNVVSSADAAEVDAVLMDMMMMPPATFVGPKAGANAHAEDAPRARRLSGHTAASSAATPSSAAGATGGGRTVPTSTRELLSTAPTVAESGAVSQPRARGGRKAGESVAVYSFGDGERVVHLQRAGGSTASAQRHKAPTYFVGPAKADPDLECDAYPKANSFTPINRARDVADGASGARQKSPRPCEPEQSVSRVHQHHRRLTGASVADKPSSQTARGAPPPTRAVALSVQPISATECSPQWCSQEEREGTARQRTLSANRSRTAKGDPRGLSASDRHRRGLSRLDGATVGSKQLPLASPDAETFSQLWPLLDSTSAHQTRLCAAGPSGKAIPRAQPAPCASHELSVHGSVPPAFEEAGWRKPGEVPALPSAEPDRRARRSAPASTTTSNTGTKPSLFRKLCGGASTALDSDTPAPPLSGASSGPPSLAPRARGALGPQQPASAPTSKTNGRRRSTLM